jgi:GT2 family glycosyltransferase
VFTDDDVLVQPDWFGALVRALMAAGPRNAVTGQVRPGAALTPDGFAPTIMLNETPRVYEGRPGEDVLFPMNMAMYRLAFETVGYFDERLGAGAPFPGSEDNDLGLRLLEAGFRIVYVPEASLIHRAWRTAQDYLPLRWNYGFGQGAFYAKHLNLKDRYILGRLWHDVARHTYRLVRYPLVRARRQTAADGLYVLGVLYGAARWLITQRKTA